ncbi:MAG TPA: Holliday junction resolvase RuvX [Alphaproteobacteria bacterium]|nr:Holliday junction resolvase RuvX [Alphaproteobacteria bacterium]HAJ47467.1 Holliday junction resolvase RuvX [Alphaproteobacteria bacterium]
MTLDLPTLKAQLGKDQRLLGLDLGEKTIGLALSDVSLTIASPLETLRRSKLAKDLESLKALAAKHAVGGLVLGLPLNMDGTAGPRVQATRAFAASVDKLWGMPLAFWDERLSTAAVTRMMIEGDLSRARRAELVDKLAAAYILQGALDLLKKS